MQYTKVDKAEVGAEIYKQDAIEAARDEFAAACEAERLEALKLLATTDEEGEAIQAAVDRAADVVAKASKRAARKRRLFEVDQHDIDHAILEFLDSWIAQIEREHAEASVRLEALEDELDDEEAGLEEEEQKFIEAQVSDKLSALKVLESAWKIATSHKEELSHEDDSLHNTK